VKKYFVIARECAAMLALNFAHFLMPGKDYDTKCIFLHQMLQVMKTVEHRRRKLSLLDKQMPMRVGTHNKPRPKHPRHSVNVPSPIYETQKGDTQVQE
jgi:hypothetical protein